MQAKDSSTAPLRGSARNDNVRRFGILVLVLSASACNRGLDVVREQLAGRSRSTIDSLSAQNASLQRQMVVFERISAEKDTLLREVRDAHVLIEAVAEQLRRMDGSPMEFESVDSAGMATTSTSMGAGAGGSDSVVAVGGDVGVDAAGEFPAGPGTYREGNISPFGNGTPEAPIVLQADPSGAATGDPLDRGDEVGQVVDPVLEQIANPLCALLQELERVALLHILGENEHGGLRVLVPDFLRCA